MRAAKVGGDECTRDAESRAARESERAIRCWPRLSRRASSVAAAVGGQIRVRRDPARRHGEEAAYAGVSAVIQGERAPAQGKKSLEVWIPAPWFCGTMRGRVRVWMRNASGFVV